MPRRYLVLWISFLLQREREVSFERPSMRPKVVEPDRNTFQIYTTSSPTFPWYKVEPGRHYYCNTNLVFREA